ncbi:MAG: hypothetical protein ACM3N6_15730 [Betaproteobacteria bacterium]
MYPTDHLLYSSPTRPGHDYILESKPEALPDGRFAVRVFIDPDDQVEPQVAHFSIRPDVAPFAAEVDAIEFGLALGRQWVDRHG